MRKCEWCKQYKDYPHFPNESWTCKACAKLFAEMASRKTHTQAVVNANRQQMVARWKRGQFDTGAK